MGGGKGGDRHSNHHGCAITSVGGRVGVKRGRGVSEMPNSFSCPTRSGEENMKGLGGLERNVMKVGEK